MRNVYFDSVNLNSGPYLVTDFTHEGTAEQEIQSYPLARERGAVVIAGEYGSKEFTISGLIKGDSLTDLDTKRHAFMELVSREGKTLDVDYGGETLRYKNVMVIGRSITRNATDVSVLRFTLTFLVPSGIGISTTLTEQDVAGITSASYAGSITILGSAQPRPLIELTFGTITGTLNAFSFLLGGNKIELATAIVTGDILIVDTENKKVTLNGVEKEYTGFFPEFAIGLNNFTITTNGTTRTYTLHIEYNKSYF